MTNATLAFAVALLGWAPLVVLLAWRLRRAEKDIAMLLRNAGHQSRDIGTVLVVAADLRVANDRLRDDLADLRAEYLAQARALDAHDERLITLERDSEEARTAYFKTAATVEDHGGRLDHVEQYTPEP